jgi:hypothetical protein
LDLHLFIDTEHHHLIGRVEVQADNVADCFDKEGIRRQLEGLVPVRPHWEHLQPAMSRCLGNPSYCP